MVEFNFTSLILDLRKNIMIANHKLKRYFRERANKCSNHLPFFIIMTVKKITKENHSLRTDALNQRQEFLQIFFICLCRHRYSGFSKMIDLTKMQISNQESPFCLPVNGFFRQQQQLFINYTYPHE